MTKIFDQPMLDTSVLCSSLEKSKGIVYPGLLVVGAWRFSKGSTESVADDVALRSSVLNSAEAVAVQVAVGLDYNLISSSHRSGGAGPLFR
jgi:predicted anti-sigma-YlaC factor YlaD